MKKNYIHSILCFIAGIIFTFIYSFLNCNIISINKLLFILFYSFIGFIIAFFVKRIIEKNK